jgi:hypothetical protein
MTKRYEVGSPFGSGDAGNASDLEWTAFRQMLASDLIDGLRLNLDKCLGPGGAASNPLLRHVGHSDSSSLNKVSQL